MPEYYEFDCGCKVEIIDDKIKDYDGLPSMDIDYENLNLDCPVAWDLLSSGKTRGVFQLETPLGMSWAKKIEPDSLEEMSALIAILRPSCLKGKVEGKSIAQHYVDRKSGLDEVRDIDFNISDILSNTKGLILYQESSLQISQRLANFDLKEADALRRCVTKDTMFVSKTRGWISIEKLLKEGYLDDLFLIMDENGIQSWKKLVNIWSTGIKCPVVVETEFGYDVTATQYHQFMTDTGWKARQRLSTEDYLLATSEISYDGKDEISVELAIVIAGLITEGYFADKTKNGKKTTCHFTNYDQGFMKTFTDSFYKVFGVYPSMNNQNRNAKIKVYQRDFINQYLDYGLSGDKYIPEVLMRMTKESMRLFLSYMLGAEGGISKSGQFEYSSKSIRCIKQIKYLLLRYGVRSNIIPKFNKKYNCCYYSLYITDVTEQQKLIDELSILWPESKIKTLKQIIEKKKKKGFTSDLIPQSIVTKILNQYPFIGNGESGSLYNRPITKDRFNRIALKTQDPYWINLFNGKQFYTKVKSLDTIKKEREVFDFTVEGDSTPYIIANGLVIHNSIGKKDAQLMAKVRLDFIKGCEKTGLVNNDKANEIFDIIEKANRFSFNKSHSISYGMIGYWTAWLKSHFPLAFFSSWLSFSDKDDVGDFINDSKEFDVDIRNPSILLENENFKIVDGKVYCGIGNIKGVGETTAIKTLNIIKELQEEVGKELKDFSWIEILILLTPRLTKTTVINLIAAGAFSHLNIYRKRMMFEYNQMSSLTGKKEIPFLADNIQVIKSLDDGVQKLISSGIATKSRMQKIESCYKTLTDKSFTTIDDENWVSSIEEELIGGSLSCSKLDVCDTTCGDTTCSQFLNKDTDKKINIACQVDRVSFYTPKNGKKMLYVTIKDTTGSVEAVVFSDNVEKVESVLYKGNTVCITGKKTQKGSLSVYEAIQI